MVLTIERANAAPSAAGGAKDDAAETMDSIEGVRDGDGGAPLWRHRGLEVSGGKTGHSNLTLKRRDAVEVNGAECALHSKVQHPRPTPQPAARSSRSTECRSAAASGRRGASRSREAQLPQELLVTGNVSQSLVLELRELLLFKRRRRLALALGLRKRLALEVEVAC